MINALSNTKLSVSLLLLLFIALGLVCEANAQAPSPASPSQPLRYYPNSYKSRILTPAIRLQDKRQWSQSSAKTVVQGEQKCIPACSKLLANAQRQNRITVIVEHNIPNLPDEGRVPRDQRIATRIARQNAIRLANEQFEQRMHGYKGMRIQRKLNNIPHMVMTVDVDSLRAITADPSVSAIQEDVPLRPMLVESIPLISADQAWAAGSMGAGQSVIVLDTGVDETHPFLASKVLSQYEACFSGTNPNSVSLCPNGQTQQTGPGAGTNCTLSGCDHGTHVAGIAVGNGSFSFSGVAKAATIIPMQVFSRVNDPIVCAQIGASAPCITAYLSDIDAALNEALTLSLALNVAAVNMSVGGGAFSGACDSNLLKPAIDSLRDVGIATVVAAGNNSCGSQGCSNAISMPACISTAISVGATTKNDTVPIYSNSASFLKLLAPGGNLDDGPSNFCAEAKGGICSSVPGGSFAYMSGTSQATPHVSGAFALLKSLSPTAAVDDLLSILQGTGVPVTDPRNGMKFPRIDLKNPPWAARYPNNQAYGAKIAKDPFGNVYIFDPGTGVLIKYDYSGNSLWTNNVTALYSMADLAADASGNAYIATTVCDDSTCFGSHIAVDKYSPDGQILWSASGTTTAPMLSLTYSVAVDVTGNVSVVSSDCPDSTQGCGQPRVATHMFNTNGALIWERTYSYGLLYPAGLDSGHKSHYVDSAGNIYVAGTSCTLANGCPNVLGDTAVVIKYDAGGMRLWSSITDIGGSGGGVTAASIDGSGNFVTSTYVCTAVPECLLPDNSPPTIQVVTKKYDPNGNVLWSATYSNVADAIPSAVTMDKSGNIYVTAMSCSSIGPNVGVVGANGCVDYGWATIKYNSNGGQMWTQRYSDTSAVISIPDGMGNFIINPIPEGPLAVAADTNGNVYVVGYSGPDSTFSVLKYDPDGGLLRTFTSSPGAATDVTVDALNNSYVTGGAADATGGAYLTMKFIQ